MAWVNCSRCGVEFLATRGNRQFCGEECGGKASLERRGKGPRPKPAPEPPTPPEPMRRVVATPVPRPCEVCGTMHTRSRAATCSHRCAQRAYKKRYGIIPQAMSVDATGPRPKRRPGYNEWTPGMVEALHQLYGVYTAAEVAKRLNTTFGVALTTSAVHVRAYREGIDSAAATGDLTLREAARELGVDYSGLHKRAHRLGLEMHGRGKYRYLTEASLEALRRAYAAPPEPTYTIEEAAERLICSAHGVYSLVYAGHIKAYRPIRRLLLSRAQVDERRRMTLGLQKGASA